MEEFNVQVNDDGTGQVNTFTILANSEEEAIEIVAEKVRENAERRMAQMLRRRGLRVTRR